jgi:hypothetical protein
LNTTPSARIAMVASIHHHDCFNAASASTGCLSINNRFYYTRGRNRLQRSVLCPEIFSLFGVDNFAISLAAYFSALILERLITHDGWGILISCPFWRGLPGFLIKVRVVVMVEGEAICGVNCDEFNPCMFCHYEEWSSVQWISCRVFQGPGFP